MQTHERMTVATTKWPHLVISVVLALVVGPGCELSLPISSQPNSQSKMATTKRRKSQQGALQALDGRKLVFLVVEYYRVLFPVRKRKHVSLGN